MSTKTTLPFTCPCEKSHGFEETFQVAGPGQTTVQLRCPYAQCPAKNALLTFPIPYTLMQDERPIKRIQPDEQKP